MKELIAIQSQLKANKSQFNKFGNYSYRSCEDILESVKPLLKVNNAILTISDEMVLVGERVYVKATSTITVNDKSISVSAFAREPLAQKGMSESQITGSASSYARKYSLNGLFCIDDTKDADTMDNRPVANVKPTEDKASTKQRAQLKDYVVRFEAVNDLKAIEYIKTNLSDPNLTESQAEQIINRAGGKLDD